MKNRQINKSVGCDNNRQKALKKHQEKNNDVYAWLGVGIVLAVITGILVYTILILV